jgi:hypothetical protein
MSITLIVIPGPGARTVEITPNMSIADLVAQESLHGRDIIVEGVGILPENFDSTALSNGAEVFATGSVKGN